MTSAQTHLTLALATEQDLDDLFTMVEALSDFLGETHEFFGSKESLGQHGFGEQRLFQALIARNAGSPVGLSLFYPEYSSWRGQAGVYILDLYVDSAFRGTGLGRQLVKETLATANQQWQAQYIRLAVHTHNAKAAAFYQQLGFSRCEDDLIMIIGHDQLPKSH